jgi:N-acetylglutamate synthase-like GNAT family acetyltransferase
MIRECTEKDINTIYEIVNQAAKAYEGHIPADCYHQPYMPLDELRQEMKTVIMYGWEESDQLVGVMGLEISQDVSLIRHAYVSKEWQGKGIGSQILQFILQQVKTPSLLVGTWADAIWAVDFYKRHGFLLLKDKDLLLRKYWDISQRQIETSVVLEKKMKSVNS